MAAYIPGAGRTKPLNQLRNPIYPAIKNPPPRFVWSGKHWLADAAVMMDTSHINQFYESAILTVPRDYNQTTYGVSSFRSVVNDVFRPPLIDPIDDVFPLSRIPAMSKAIVPRINPSTAGHSGTSGYTAKNERISNIAKHLTDRVTTGNARPTFYCPIDVPMDNSILPDLEMTIPSISATAGMVYPTFDAPIPEVLLSHRALAPEIDAGITTQLRLDGLSGRENFELNYNRPQVSATAGMNTPVKFDAPMETVLNLDYNRPQVSATAGMNTPIRINAPLDMETKLDLNYNRPQVSATAGMNTPIKLDAPISGNPNFETKLEAQIFTNPGTNYGYKTRMNNSRNPDEYIHERIGYSYTVPNKFNYQSRNELTHRPQVRKGLQPLKHYGKISHSSAIPRIGLDVPQIRMKTGVQKAYRF